MNDAREEETMEQVLKGFGPEKQAALERAYDSPSWWYDVRGFFILTFSYNSSLWRQIHFFEKNLSKEHLEVAVGSGTLLSMILAWHRLRGGRPGRLTGVDYAAPMLAGARRRFKNNPRVRLEQRDIVRLADPDNTYRTANIANAIHCFPDVDGGLREIFRVLRPGGTLRFNALLHPTQGPRFLRAIAARINRWGMRKGILHRPYTAADILGRARAAGFAIESVVRAGHSLEVVAVKPAALAVGTPLARPALPAADRFYREAFQRNVGILSEGSMERLRNACVAVPGLGGVGGQHALSLTRMGVGRLKLADMDQFEWANLNRQAGANARTIGRNKIDVMIEQTTAINPHLRVEAFPNGVTEGNMEEFLAGADAVVDGLDGFCVRVRRRMFQVAREKGIPVVTAGPMGHGAALLVFTPDGMSADDYFDWRDGMSDLELLIAFFAGLSPTLPHLRYMDPARVDLAAHRGPSVNSACLLCAGLATTEIVRCLTEPDQARPAPHYTTYDPYLRTLDTGRLWWGNRSPWRRLGRWWAYRRLESARSVLTRPGNVERSVETPNID
ncbi:MAG: methyltransferase domain-containing protein [Elusimicrobia bacterium]|nr:MAG: methyltransferase domain-containing protein [Elusimicrobiota bacterium]